ncbi:NAD(P)(+) transhydrogenase (Re/Si-specific) subunit beta [Enterobacteriaceae endosymbiont of Neohaemonia nigricornis]|uniref:NAD(P)(+) transhydrogenase (Re/Si-specific) subunit beta n=1 Tax=Enterobacteriaceae endosymbiont of Neohaemonia nigricornis TaxID=2675792 RepID=UPI0014496F3C|nr:NAD(P)(+) transhydrogenase (Re/Si-specific) subunit beta [Enterobacteriaceae endosymbiont of Neohaemonia nigricornis]QJC30275.1 Re/Si-specific NAD(P)(+) transhydrogenase subunit beta [Enterobacteriaceae endosymbiont of Neohaemonia nigricornis]
MSDKLISLIYIISAICFIFSLAYLSQKKTAHIGNLLAINGMMIAVITTILFNATLYNTIYIVIAVILGAFIGIKISKNINMTQIPQFIAILHSFVGLTAVIVGLNSYILVHTYLSNIHIIQLIEIFVSIFIGTITFIGSIIAFGKLSGLLSTKTLVVKYKYLINIFMIIITCILMFMFLTNNSFISQIVILGLMICVSLIFGFYLIMGIGGADMPVIVSMLNSYSGWAAAASGFILTNDLLIITGALVGASGAILSYLMCKGMNRSFWQVVFGSNYYPKNINHSNNIKQKHQEINIEKTIKILKNSNNIIIVPGYGLAVSQAQYLLSQMIYKLKKYNINIRLAIHPVAGRLPGHMNVLLAEAKIPYNMVFEMDEINKDFSTTDTVLVIGANDTVNPLAQQDQNSPIAGMPVLEVWKSNNIIIFKRSMGQGYSGINNPLFTRKNSYMLFGDAKNNINKILSNI